MFKKRKNKTKMNTPQWLTKVQAAWTAIGTILIFLAANGITFPPAVTEFFSSATIDAFTVAFNAVVAAFGAVVTFYQLVRAMFTRSDAEVNLLSTETKWTYALNPFKTKVN